MWHGVCTAARAREPQKGHLFLCDLRHKQVPPRKGMMVWEENITEGKRTARENNEGSRINIF